MRRLEVDGPVVLPGTDHFRMLPMLGRSSREDRDSGRYEVLGGKQGWWRYRNNNYNYSVFICTLLYIVICIILYAVTLVMSLQDLQRHVMSRTAHCWIAQSVYDSDGICSPTCRWVVLDADSLSFFSVVCSLVDAHAAFCIFLQYLWACRTQHFLPFIGSFWTACATQL